MARIGGCKVPCPLPLADALSQQSPGVRAPTRAGAMGVIGMASALDGHGSAVTTFTALL